MPATVRTFQRPRDFVVRGRVIDPMKASDKHWADIIIYTNGDRVDLSKVRGDLRVAIVSDGAVQVIGVLNEEEAA